jgi:hypothetical protein
MIGMGNDNKKIGALILALKGPEQMKAPEVDPEEMLELCAKRVLAAIQANDAELLIAELPKLLRNLPEPEYADE